MDSPDDSERTDVVGARLLATTTYTDVAAAPLVLVPLGSIEQHGPHLPLNTDAEIATAVANQVAVGLEERLTRDVFVAPTWSYGASGEHQSFPGTTSIGSQALAFSLIELVRSLSTWAGRVVFVNAHGGNCTGLDKAVRQLVDEGHDVAWVACATEALDAHAGITETSLMLHIAPSTVRLERAEPGNTEPLTDLLERMTVGGVEAVTANGVLGDPTGATAAEGERLLRLIVDDVTERIAAYAN